ncbi:cell division protein FtsQ [Pedobacter sp. JY14-1]|uniref:cell division protein FtsQ/DivIB n=1 Tax=Pedobacter sp. JY14-1 TaxID=3034151 RepID=UPI0023E2ED45|nr:cell division protein FtsQ [Pedobacter sp. JY14-1]
MIKRMNWRMIFRFSVWMLCMGGIVVLMSFIAYKKQDLVCKGVSVLMPGAENFIERDEVDAILLQSQGVLTGRKLSEINLEKIEQNIRSNPYIAFAKVFADMDGIVHVEVKQRKPILRVINLRDQDFYVDADGLKMPVSSNFTANVIVANGKIQEYFSGKVDTLITGVAKDLFKTAAFLRKDTLWEAQIEQMYVNDKNDIELIPRVGNQRIILGSADSLEVKMRNLLAFYKQAMPKMGWETYKTINIKYTNQIVCEKTKVDSAVVKPGKSLTETFLPPDTIVDINKNIPGKTNNNKLNKSI